MSAFTIGLIFGAFFVGGGGAAFNYYWCSTRHGRPALGIFAGIITFLGGLALGLIAVVPFTILFMITAVAFSKKTEKPPPPTTIDLPPPYTGVSEAPSQKAS